ncbi:ester hydrolase C11orf54 homolog [Belonocnema kinseyi]|uniref:ester hydrolase C11orf54 homolog n=1 Tax=Belonocnema kinseyi TaxID=2817044 RepID=UPI00143DC387|nr:ester hydrolase C11orf54 homolog [Belonocnema kinseyi]
MIMKSFSCSKAVFIFVITSLLCIKSSNAIEGQFLYCPTLEDLQTIFTKALSRNFAEVSVKVVQCPELNKKPFKLATKGLDGDPVLLAVGMQNPDIGRKLTKVYDLENMLYIAGHERKSFIIGAAQGPWPYNKKRSLMAVNVVLDKEKETSRVAILDENNNNYVLETLPANETRFSHKANLFVSKGKTGKVLEVHVKNRIGSESFIEIMQKALASHYNKDFIVGLGGVFLVTKGNVKQLLIPSSLEQPSHPDKDFYSFNMSAPLIAVGSFISAKTELNFVEHNFHSFSLNGGGGHFQNDVTPNIVEYLAYFNTAGTEGWRRYKSFLHTTNDNQDNRRSYSGLVVGRNHPDVFSKGFRITAGSNRHQRNNGTTNNPRLEPPQTLVAPSARNFVSVKMLGEDILVGNLRSPTDGSNVPNRLFVRLMDRSILIADLVALENTSNQYYPENRCFIKIEENYYLSAFLQAEYNITQIFENISVRLVQRTNNNTPAKTYYGYLHRHHNNVPDWARGLPTGR